jgi:flavin reductase (DIM6/NTAB) family NADH-FMN oxidoreductase RutF
MEMISATADVCHRMLAPRIAYLIGTNGVNGPNVTPISNVTQVSARPQVFAIAVYRQWESYKNLQNVAGFSLSVPRIEHADVVWRLGNKFSGFVVPRGENKLSASGGDFDFDASRYGPVLSDATGWCECEILREIEDFGGDHGVFLGRVTHGAFNPEYMRPNGTYMKNTKEKLGYWTP